MMAAPAAAAAAAGGYSSSSTLSAAAGQLTWAEFTTALRLFCQWWDVTFPEQPRWVVQSVVLPVTHEVVEYVRLDRAVLRPTNSLQPSSAAAAAAAAAVTLDAARELADAAAHWPASTIDGRGAASLLARSRDNSFNTSSSSSTVPDITSEEVKDDEATATGASCYCGDIQAGLCQQQQQRPEPHLHSYSVVWHDIYKVPVLYIGGSHTDGRPLTLAELSADLPQLAQLQQEGTQQQASWTYISAVAHPVTGAAAFMLHPCQTATRMQLLMEQQQQQHAPDSAEVAAVDGGHSDEAQPGAPAEALLATDVAPGRLQGEASAADHAAVLLRYMQGWFSMVAPLLGLSVLGPCVD